MAASLPRLAVNQRRGSAALARTLRATALRRLQQDERGWVARIDSRRLELGRQRESVPAGFEDGRGTAPGWAEGVNRPVPIWGMSHVLSVPAAWGVFQLRLVRELAPLSCIELGTGMGISTAYQAAGLELNGGGKLTSLEGARAWATIAQDGLSELGLSRRAEVRVGPIDDLLHEALEEISPVDYAFLDADHSEDATVRHFDALSLHLAPGSLVLLDDISFSRGMWRAWKTIRCRERVAQGLSLGRMGVLVID